jgi:hypothetical protein
MQRPQLDILYRRESELYRQRAAFDAFALVARVYWRILAPELYELPALVVVPLGRTVEAPARCAGGGRLQFPLASFCADFRIRPC